ncbi:hypothetical protein NSK_005450 [Nannochloropsis salina CCMP1776]|uniref:Uncharacterized protein n=1 Tax=Nannochloropsis salina CCMP1776 TaxID=1027361 RepID=A0A4D9CVG8_9STRA|nr:hypothetical protein NSK_005450 [Nannochloropsis salina CCMP1776]|eukprot:TFJ83232.1 hypothetical protein NSK_005450 [Nannochloropsis salina CCMP1776]
MAQQQRSLAEETAIRRREMEEEIQIQRTARERASTASRLQQKIGSRVEGLQKEWEGKVEENFDWILKERQGQDWTASSRAVFHRVLHLFRGHPDLLQGFSYFLPACLQAEAQEHVVAAGVPRPVESRRGDFPRERLAMDA